MQNEGAWQQQCFDFSRESGVGAWAREQKQKRSEGGHMEMTCEISYCMLRFRQTTPLLYT